MTVTGVIWPFTTHNVVFPCDRHGDTEFCLLLTAMTDFTTTTKKWFYQQHIITIYYAIHTADYQSTQGAHLTTTISNLQRVSGCHHTAFMERKYTTEFLITYINAWSNFHSAGL